MRVADPFGARTPHPVVTRRPPARLALLAVVMSFLAVSGCGEVEPHLGPPLGQGTSTSRAPEGETVRATGTVVAGAEPGCLLLDAGDTRYLLLDGDRDRLEPGDKVRVIGVVEMDAPTTCMEGVPVHVAEVDPVPAG